MKEQLKQCGNLLVFLFKLIIYFSCFWVFYRLYAIENWQLLGLSRTSAVTTLSYVISGYLFLKIYGGYDIGKRKSKPIITSLSLATVMTDIVAYVMLCVMNTNSANNIRFEFEQPWLLLIIFVIQIVLIIIAAYGGNWVYFTIYEPENCLIITSSKQSLDEITRGIKKYRLQYKIGGNADYKNENLKEIIPKFDTIFLYDVPSMERTQIVEFCYQNMKRVYINPSMADVVEMHSRHIMLDDMSLFEMSLLGLNAEQNFFKRIFDFILALLALIITFPIVIIAALAII